MRAFHWPKWKEPLKISRKILWRRAGRHIFFLPSLLLRNALLSWFVNKNMKHEAGVIQHSITRCSSRRVKSSKAAEMPACCCMFVHYSILTCPKSFGRICIRNNSIIIIYFCFQRRPTILLGFFNPPSAF